MGEIVTTVLRNRSGELADNYTKNNALLNRLKKRGKVKPATGGRTLVHEIAYQENGTFGRYSGYETINIAPSDVITGAEFDWRQAVVAVTMSGYEQLISSGEDAVLDLLEERITNASGTLTNNIALDCYSDGTADGGRQIGGLQLLVAKNPTTGVVGGFDRSTTAALFWRNQKFQSTTDGGAASSAANIQKYMNKLYLKLCRGADKPDLIVADNDYYEKYLESLQAIQRITSSDEAMAGFGGLKYMSADVVADGFLGGGAPTSSMYMLNTNYIMFRPHKDRNFVPINGDRAPVNQDAMVKLIGFMGNMTMNNAQLQGILFE